MQEYPCISRSRLTYTPVVGALVEAAAVGEDDGDQRHHSVEEDSSRELIRLLDEEGVAEGDLPARFVLSPPPPHAGEDTSAEIKSRQNKFNFLMRARARI